MNRTMLSEALSWSEIDWINDTDFDFRSARVAGHGKTRREPLEQARPLQAQYPSMGHFFTGRARIPVAALRGFNYEIRSVEGQIRVVPAASAG